MSVLNYLSDIASNLVLSASEKSSIETSISTLRARLNDWFVEDIREQIRFGSSTRGTILPKKADWNSDIDYMIIFYNDIGYKPQTFINRLKNFAEAKYSSSEIHQSHPTVVLQLNHIKFDLVPAYKSGLIFQTIYIPAPITGFEEWTKTDPNSFNQTLANANYNHNGKIKPMIRLVKYWNALNGYVYDSYSLEQDLVGNSYFFCSNLKDYFFHAIEGLSTWWMADYKAEKVRRAKDIIAQVKEFERWNMFVEAEEEIKKLI